MSAADVSGQLRADVEHILAQNEGARLAASVIDFCGVFTANEAGDLFREGMRNVGLMIYDVVRSAPNGERAYLSARDELVKLFEKKEESNDG